MRAFKRGSTSKMDIDLYSSIVAFYNLNGERQWHLKYLVQERITGLTSQNTGTNLNSDAID